MPPAAPPPVAWGRSAGRPPCLAPGRRAPRSRPGMGSRLSSLKTSRRATGSSVEPSRTKTCPANRAKRERAEPRGLRRGHRRPEGLEDPSEELPRQVRGRAKNACGEDSTRGRPPRPAVASSRAWVATAAIGLHRRARTSAKRSSVQTRRRSSHLLERRLAQRGGEVLVQKPNGLQKIDASRLRDLGHRRGLPPTRDRTERPVPTAAKLTALVPVAKWRNRTAAARPSARASSRASCRAEVVRLSRGSGSRAANGPRVP